MSLEGEIRPIFVVIGHSSGSHYDPRMRVYYLYTTLQIC